MTAIREEHMAVAKTARLFMLGEPEGAQDIWIVCHGYGQLAGNFIREFACINTPQRLIVAPEGLHRFYIDPPPMPARERRVGATWMTREDRDSDIRDNTGYLDRVVAYVSARARTPFRLRTLGFSQGAATAFRWAALGQSVIHELILWAGEVPTDVASKQTQRLRATRIVLAHGRQDDMAPKHGIARHQATLEEAGLRFQTYEYNGGHRLDDALLQQLASAL